MNIINEDTIAAIATPPGIGALSIIRVSGSKAFEVVDSFFQGKSKILNAISHTIHYGKILDYNGNLIDDVLVSVFKEPNSYTGEDCVEISTHGNPLISKRIKLLLANDIRIANRENLQKGHF
jgi:tRNA modification GTPase